MPKLTVEEHVQRVRQVAFQLERADYGLGMPRDYQMVCRLKVFFEQVAQDAIAAIHDAFVHGDMTLLDAVMAVEAIGEQEAQRVVEEWADLAEATAHPERIESEAQEGY